MTKRGKASTAEASDPMAVEIRAKVRSAGAEAVEGLLMLVRGAKSESVKLAAVKELLDRGFGRVATLSGENGAAKTAHVLVDDGYAD